MQKQQQQQQQQQQQPQQQQQQQQRRRHIEATGKFKCVQLLLGERQTKLIRTNEI